MRRSRVRFLVAAPEPGRASRAVSRDGPPGVAFRFARPCAAPARPHSPSLTRGARKRTISRLLCGIPGGVPEWPKGPDCKSDGFAFVGSNPTPSTTRLRTRVAGEREGLAPRTKRQREGLAPRMKGQREGLAPRMKEPSAGEREGLAPRMKGQREGLAPRKRRNARGRPWQGEHGGQSLQTGEPAAAPAGIVQW